MPVPPNIFIPPNVFPEPVPVPAPAPAPAPSPAEPAPGPFDPTVPLIPLNPPSALPAPSTGPVGPMPDWQQFLIWIGALVVLWFILTAADEAGYGTYANGFAGVLVLGALMFMGKQAIANAQALTQPRKG
jgi:hypothetical protein